ncbi:UPF0496 protein At3g19330-like [Macadamia integrifolia]|uniref:UPF0496 protein At3g19330-like n=1 Tax=Macadamia integrifolia TaxID=60698 RepID=UPI001C4EE2EE|nr:UPF0496 protein At3g19330-like [Macadamia integrifolia]XP_042484952.1 UPF0496 protein At3g19330-like [Macadamia integrifolia]XP_042484953.1 UPF0496 protein At3g19330-like [Macadamia integrifolia]XP_042484954.1 UPF0496 protein At3g19330-like [Macadamia integrifolia]XP_042484955.1 UPF0496 protein At3g19330-like [Macadamia integrifolia]XP_042484957.1 UPF0496 protein At3g19330-like [Macadamia integrifolia]
MLMRCLTNKSTTVLDPSVVNTPRRSQSAVNLSQEFSQAVDTNPYKDKWTQSHNFQEAAPPVSAVVVVEAEAVSAQLLSPNNASVEEVLSRTRPNNLTPLVSDYFKNSEHTYRICSLLQNTINDARSLYEALHGFLENLPLDFESDTSLFSQSQCDSAYDVFLKFDGISNPFPQPGSDNFLNKRRCFSELKLQLDHQVQKSRRRNQLIRKKEVNRIAQLEAASRGTFYLIHDLNTIDRLVARLYDAVESDKFLVRFGLQRGRDRYPIQAILKQLRKSQPNLKHQLKDLEDHVCLCFGSVNQARSLLLREIHHQQTPRTRRTHTI